MGKSWTRKTAAAAVDENSTDDRSGPPDFPEPGSPSLWGILLDIGIGTDKLRQIVYEAIPPDWLVGVGD